MGIMGWTYVGEMRMREYQGKFGRALCDLVSECCMHMPGDRPDLTQLSTRINAALAQRPNQFSADDARFINRTLHTPPRPNISPPTVGSGVPVVLPW